MSTIKNYAVMIRSEVLESIWVLAESEIQANDFARFVHRNNPDVHLVDRAILETRVITEQPVLGSNPKESGEQ